MKGQWRIGARNLRRHPRRSLATAFSIAVGFAGLIFTFGYILRSEAYLRVARIYLQHTGHLSIYKTGGLSRHLARPQTLNLSAEERASIEALLRQEPGIERVAAYLSTTGLLSNGCQTVPYNALGIDLPTEQWIFTHPLVRHHNLELTRPLKGRGIWEVEGIDTPVALAGGLARVARKPLVVDEVVGTSSTTPGEPILLDCTAPDALTRVTRDANVQLVSSDFSGAFTALDAEVAAILNTGFTEFEDRLVMLPLDKLQQLHDTDRVTWIAAWLEDPGEVRSRAADLERRLRAKGIDVTVIPWNDDALSPSYTSIVRFLVVLGSFILAILVGVVGLSLVNSMTMAVIERSREFGTLRAIGFRPVHILRLLLIEVTVLAGAGIAAGLALGLGAARLVAAANIRFSPPGVAGTMQFKVTPTLELCLAAGTFIGLVALIATVVAARRTLNSRIVHLLYGDAA